MEPTAVNQNDIGIGYDLGNDFKVNLTSKSFRILCRIIEFIPFVFNKYNFNIFFTTVLRINRIIQHTSSWQDSAIFNYTSGLEYVEILHVDYIRYESDNFGREYTRISKNDLQQTSDLRLIYCSGPRLKG